nr:cytochrome b6-f complex subunit VII [Cryptomonas sp. NIES-345]BDA98426.1 cytochrome b6-f complex subunit VII [Cryptomonas sp. NIES-1327]
MGNEILVTGVVSFVITLVGLALGFVLLKLQGE